MGARWRQARGLAVRPYLPSPAGLLRERVAPYGGELLAGPRLGGGVLLRATLPVHDIADGRPDPAPGRHHDGRDDAGQPTAARASAKAAP